jgi:hypothetical protein
LFAASSVRARAWADKPPVGLRSDPPIEPATDSELDSGR